eukprot:574613-Pelagomonas_calceolata.AAC.5
MQDHPRMPAPKLSDLGLSMKRFITSVYYPYRLAEDAHENMRGWPVPYNRMHYMAFTDFLALDICHIQSRRMDLANPTHEAAT